MDPNEAFVATVAIVTGCVLLVFLFRYGAQVVRSLFGTPAAGAGEDAASLTQGEVEGMIRRAVREEVRREVQPLREKIERIETRVAPAEEKQPRPDLMEDPHDFGLIADAGPAREERAA